MLICFFILFASIILNGVLIALLVFTFIYRALDGCAEIANGKLGVLTRDIEVGQFNKNETIFNLPKGLIVQDVSATGMDRFEPFRFRIVVSTEAESLVDYSTNLLDRRDHDGEYYSADVVNHIDLQDALKAE